MLDTSIQKYVHKTKKSLGRIKFHQPDPNEANRFHDPCSMQYLHVFISHIPAFHSFMAQRSLDLYHFSCPQMNHKLSRSRSFIKLPIYQSLEMSNAHSNSKWRFLSSSTKVLMAV